MPSRKFASDENEYAPRIDRGKLIASELYKTSTPARTAWPPTWRDRLSTSSYILFNRRVGAPDNVPKVATPAMVTAGPIESLGGAFRSPYPNCLAARRDDLKLIDRVHAIGNPAQPGRVVVGRQTLDPAV